MNEIICPNCKTPFTIDENGYADIVRQVRDEEFDRVLQERIAQVQKVKDAEFGARQAEAEKGYGEQMAQRDAELQRREAEIDQLKERMEAQRKEASLTTEAEVRKALAQAQETVAKLEAANALLEERAKTARKEAEDEARLAAVQTKAETDAAAARAKAEADAAALQVKAEHEAAMAQAEREIDGLKAQMAQASSEKDLELQGARNRITQLNEQMASQARQAEADRKIALAEAQQAADAAARELEKKAADAENALALAQANAEAADAAHREELALKDKAKQDEIALRDRQIESLLQMRRELSVKMLGENLEQYCENEFNKLRPTAFQNAEFGKDNDASGGSKGDYIYREPDGVGGEVVSIMFEMKTEAEDSADRNRKRNSDHFAKLDRDRRAKGCEYAVLVSELEMDNELYEGITDVSYQSGFEKMYVIRPKFFIATITLIRNAAFASLGVRRELAAVKQRDLDLTHFEERLEDFKDRFGNSCRLANANFEKAIKDIDDTIKKLQRIRDELSKSGKQLDAAENHLGKLTRRSLSYKNETVRAAFKDYDERKAAGLVEPYASLPRDIGDEPDVIEAELIEE